MEVFGVVTSAITVAQISSKIFLACQDYYLSAKNARADIQRLSSELAELTDVMEAIGDMGKISCSNKLSILKTLCKPNGALEQCRADLGSLAERLDVGTGDKTRFGLRALKWPFSSKDVDKAIMTIERYKATFNLALTADQT